MITKSQHELLSFQRIYHFSLHVTHTRKCDFASSSPQKFNEAGKIYKVLHELVQPVTSKLRGKNRVSFDIRSCGILSLFRQTKQRKNIAQLNETKEKYPKLLQRSKPLKSRRVTMCVFMHSLCGRPNDRNVFLRW